MEIVATKKPYETLSDLEKLQKQWHKLSGLHSREEWSAAIVRAATAAEIAATFAVRSEFNASSQFNAKFVDSLLRWANGLAGKVDRLLLQMSTEDKDKLKKLKELKRLADEVNTKRNAIAHQGEFCNEAEAKAAIKQARQFITDLVKIYDTDFELKEQTAGHTGKKR